jgi:rhodanese-related sulfurtransferase
MIRLPDSFLEAHMRRFLPLIALLVLGALALGACSDGSAAEFTRVAAEDFQSEIEADPDGTVVDLRTNEEIAVGFIDGAVQLDFYDPSFSSTLESLDRDAHYLVYCNSGNRSAQTVREMKDLGFTNVTELEGGIVAWNAAGLPVVTP